MAGAFPWIVVSVAVALIVLGAVFIIMAKRKKGVASEPDYRTFFYMGLVWVLFGAPMMFLHRFEFNALFAMGVIFLVMGAANRKKWKKKELTKRQKKVQYVSVAVGVAVLLLLSAYMLLRP